MPNLITSIILLTREDFAPYRALPNGIDMEERVDPYTREAQNIELLDVLGEELWYDFMNNNTSAIYQTLFNGEAYTVGTKTILYQGIKPFLVYIALARFVLNNPVTATAWGMSQKLNDYSDPVTDKTLARISENHRSSAQQFENGIVKYLDAKKLIYPLWKSTCDSSGANTGAIRLGLIQKKC